MNFVEKLQRRLLKGRLITTLMIRREYARTHADGDNLQWLVDASKLREDDFPVSDLKLSLDDFSRKQGWMR